MIFRQLYEPETSTYTYLFGDEASRRAVLLDPVLETFERDLEVLDALGLTLEATLETHIHADHLTSATKLKALTGCRIAGPAMDGLSCTDIGIGEDKPFAAAGIVFHPIHTPGHTATHHAYRVDMGALSAVFTGDALLIDGCGRTDFQQGDSEALYRSVREKLFTLPGDTLVYPAHDYQGRRVSTIAQERARNPRLKDGIGKDAFVAIMAGLGLPYPKKIDFAVPGNQDCGRCPEDAPAKMRDLCEPSVQG